MSNPSKEKGTRAETLVKETLKKATGLKWERTPGSGALDPKHNLKGDLYIPNEHNLYCVEVKHYEEDHMNTGILHNKSPQLIDWWEQTVRQASQVNKLPLLIFKHDRSKLFVAFTDMPEEDFHYIYISRQPYEFYVSLLDNWLECNDPQFIK